MEDRDLFRVVSWHLEALQLPGGVSISVLESVLVVDRQGNSMCHNIPLKTLKAGTDGSFMVSSVNWNFEVVAVLSAVDREVRLVCLEGHAESDFGSEHHNRALHVVVHDVFESWLEGFLADFVEINVFVGANLDSNVASDEVNLSSHLFQLVVLFPEMGLLVNLEEKNGTGGSDDERFVEKKVHVSKILISDLFKSECLNVINAY